MVLSPKSPLSPGVLYYSLQELLLAVQKNVLVASNDVAALPAHNCWIYQLARKSQIVQL